MKKLSLYLYCLFALLIKGLVLGLGWPEAYVSIFLIGAAVFEKWLTVNLSTKEIEKEIKKTELEVIEKQNYEHLEDKVKSLEGKLALAGIIKRK